MRTYCYTLSLDGEEHCLTPEDHEDDADGIARGRALLQAAVDVDRPEAAYVAVSIDEGVGDEPLGAWDWSRTAPEPVWSAEEA